VDLKEQALPKIAARSTVRAVKRARAAALPVRTRADYVSALREYHRRGLDSKLNSFVSPRKAGSENGNGGGGDQESGAFSEDWSAAFAVCEHGANVHPGARLHDSVVLRGATVERGTVLARCVVCPGARVPENQLLVDRVITD
jgi:hypothetical protein